MSNTPTTDDTSTDVPFTLTYGEIPDECDETGYKLVAVAYGVLTLAERFTDIDPAAVAASSTDPETVEKFVDVLQLAAETAVELTERDALNDLKHGLDALDDDRRDDVCRTLVPASRLFDVDVDAEPPSDQDSDIPAFGIVDGIEWGAS